MDVNLIADPLLALAGRAVREAARLCRAVQADLDRGSMFKDDRSPVTAADFGSQALVGRALAQADPGTPLVAEESSSDLERPDRAPALARALELLRQYAPDPGATAYELRGWIDHGRPEAHPRRYWCLDPIDGTNGFLRGDQYAIALALIEGDRPVLAAMACPRLGSGPGEPPNWPEGRLFLAKLGQGARSWPLDGAESEGVPLRVSPTTDPAEARFCERIESSAASKDDSAAVGQLLKITRPPLRMDSQAKYAAVARGDVEIYLRLPSKPGYVEKGWDHAAGALILAEAGGLVTDATGLPLDFGRGASLVNNRGIVASNGRFHDRLVAAVRSVYAAP